MRNLIVAIGILLCSSVNSWSQSWKGFTLKGKVKGLKNGTVVHLLNFDGDTLDRTSVKRGLFVFKGLIKDNANYFFLKVDSGLTSPRNYSNALWLINSSLTVSGDTGNFKNLQLVGSPPQQDYEKWMTVTDKGKVSFRDMPVVVEFLKAHPRSLFTPYLLKNMRNLFEIEYEDTALRRVANSAVYHQLCSQLMPEAKGTYWGRQLEKGFRASAMMESRKIANFNITLQDGKTVSIYELAKKNRYTLIDYWASWCAPCRSAIPQLLKAYEEFKDKGFNIVGVSTDKNKEEWKKALADDNTPWVHGLDNIDRSSESIFDLTSIPAYLLIDQEGKIVQANYSSSTPFKRSVQTFADKSLKTDLGEILGKLFAVESQQ